MDYWLSAVYSQWVTDPEDPEVKRARAERKRAGVKPPPRPIIFPVARRPEAEHGEMLLEAHEELKTHRPAVANVLAGDGEQPARRKVTIKEFLAARE